MLPLQMLYFEDLSVGMTETLKKTIDSSDVVGFAEVTGDRNPIHLSEHFAAKTPFGTRIAHGLYTASLISAVLGTRLPGPGAVYISQTLNFRAPVKIGAANRLRSPRRPGFSISRPPGSTSASICSSPGSRTRRRPWDRALSTRPAIGGRCAGTSFRKTAA